MSRRLSWWHTPSGPLPDCASCRAWMSEVDEDRELLDAMIELCRAFGADVQAARMRAVQFYHRYGHRENTMRDSQLDNVQCPQCGLVGGLHVDWNLVAAPVGTWSLAGRSRKAVASWRPVLLCGGCDLHLVGERVDEDADGPPAGGYSGPR